MSDPASERLVQLFERELRDFSTQQADSAAPPRAPKRVSGELDREVVQFASDGRTKGRTPEQMLIELKSLLSRVAPEVPSSQRSELISTVTGRAIDAFFGKAQKQKTR